MKKYSINITGRCLTDSLISQTEKLSLSTAKHENYMTYLLSKVKIIKKIHHIASHPCRSVMESTLEMKSTTF